MDLVIRLIRSKPYCLCKHMKDKVIDIFPICWHARVDNWWVLCKSKLVVISVSSIPLQSHAMQKSSLIHFRRWTRSCTLFFFYSTSMQNILQATWPSLVHDKVKVIVQFQIQTKCSTVLSKGTTVSTVQSAQSPCSQHGVQTWDCYRLHWR